MGILKKLIKKLVDKAWDASPLGQIPIISDLAKDEAIKLVEDLVTQFQNSNQIQKSAERIMSHESKENQAFVVCAAKECFKGINAENILTESHYDSWILAMEKAEDYLKKQKDLGDECERLLKDYLAPLVKAAILQLQLQLVERPEFYNQAIATHHEKIAELDGRLEEMENHNSVPENSDKIVADISTELRNKWCSLPFLERKREKGKKELREFYQLPLGKLSENGNPIVDIHELLQETIDSGNNRHERMLVLMGAPGSGKTTVITYLLNNLEIDRPVRVYPLSSFVNMNPSDWPGDILTRAGTVQKDLSNSILILDGLDELDLHGRYDQFVEKLRIAWADNDEITNFTLILTCRTNRLKINTIQCNHVILAPLTKDQICEFATDYLGQYPPNLQHCLQEKEDLCDVLGIPILLYMVLGLDLTIDTATSVATLYDEIFSLDGENSIYERCYNNQEHPITSVLSKKVHLFSQDVAIAMFSKEDVQGELNKTAYISLAQKALGDHSTYKPEDLLIGQYFLLGRKEQKIYFVHRSIFEYFVALAIFNALVELSKTSKAPEQLYREMEPGKSCDLTPLATLLSLHHLSEFPEIKNFLHHLIKANQGALSSSSDWAKLGKLIFEYGLADAVPDRPHGGERGHKEEEYRFVNLLDICRCILPKTPYTTVNLIPDCLGLCSSSYWALLYLVRKADLSELNLSQGDLSMADLSGADLSGANLTGACLTRAELFEAKLTGAKLFLADLSSANLSESILSEANMNGARLSGADLSGARLSGADLSGARLIKADLSGADLSGARLIQADLTGADLAGANLSKAELSETNLFSAILPDDRNYENALEQDGEDVMLQFTDPERWNELHPDKAVDPDRF